MVYITVLLLRCGENQVDAFGDYEPPPMEDDDAEDDLVLTPSSRKYKVSSQNNDNITPPRNVKSPRNTQEQLQQEEEEEIVNVSDDDDDDDEEEEGEGVEGDHNNKDDDKKSHASNDSLDKEEEKDTFDTQERGQHIVDQINHPPVSPLPPFNEQPTTTTNDDDERPRRLRLSEYMDPFLTNKGYHTAKDAFTSLMTAISESTNEERRMACFSAPTKACTGTAYMIGCSNLNHYNNLRWQLSTKTSLQAPCAIPIVVHNSLCTKDPPIDRCGGDQPVVDAGLLHCSASPWNDARQKCPFSHIVKQFKHKIKSWVREWKEEEEKEREKEPKDVIVDNEAVDGEKVGEQQPLDDLSEQIDEQKQDDNQTDDQLQQEQKKLEEGEEEQTRPRRVLDIQYFRLEDPSHPWSLKPMVLKNNALIDLIDPFRYKTPPRKGNLGTKRDDSTERPGPAEAVQQAVWWARQVGCDIVICVVGEAAMQELAKAGGLLGDDDQLDVPPCSLATLIADVPDLVAKENNDKEDNQDREETSENGESNEAGSETNESDDDSGEDETTNGEENRVSKQNSATNGNGESDDEEEQKVPDDYDYTEIQLGFHGFFTLEDLLSDPSQVLPAYTGPVDVIVPPPIDNDPMDIPVNQWYVFAPPKPENIPPDYPELPPFSQALQLPLPKRTHYQPPKIQYEKQIVPFVPPDMPNPHMSPQRYGVPFTSPQASPDPPRDWQDNSLDQVSYDERVPYGQQGPSYHGQPYSPMQQQQQLYRGPPYPPPQQQNFGQPYPPAEEPYRGPPYSPQQYQQQHQFHGPPYPPQRQYDNNFQGQPYPPQQNNNNFQGQQHPPQPYSNNFQGQQYPPQPQHYQGQHYPPQHQSYQEHNQYPPQQTAPHYYSPNSRDRYSSSNHTRGAAPPTVAPPDWKDE